ncbi:putative NADP-dependent mannitol dehydrogenase [Escovopsis weberi]|uniref:Putative NADP-dependent mannitol dehydrogenase n=1 Tax=Escovopsis weberi TaxID=150374 RepID=A0A0N0RTA9_ESCWE|nr:putative NADP-dependent mannitol dehydrogenase [Escovopsis weberi]
MVLAAHPNPAAPVLQHFSLAGKAALVTGGCRGIGLHAAHGLAEAGARVAITYSTTPPAEAEAVAAAISQANGGVAVRAFRCDVKSPEQVARVVEQAAAELGLGGLDVVVANAGFGEHIAALEYPDDRFREMLDVNFHGVFWTARAAARLMERQVREGRGGGGGIGRIICTASVSATLVNVPQRQAAYNASKAAVVHLAKSLAVEWVDFARVNCVSPGFIETDMIATLPKEWSDAWRTMVPGVRFADPAELKGAYVFLASDASSYMTGANLIIDGGYSLP